MKKLTRDMNKIYDISRKHEAVSIERIPFRVYLDGFDYEIWEPLSAAVEVEEAGYKILAVSY